MTLQELHDLLLNSTGDDLFGDRGDYHPKYKKFARICHPDANIGNEDLAERTFRLLQRRVTESLASLVVHSKKGQYVLQKEIFATGTISDLYLTKDARFILKVARSPKHSALMNNECSFLLKIDKELTDERLTSFFPKLVDSFAIDKNRKVNVFRYSGRIFIPISRVIDTYKEPDYRHWIWIARRIFRSLSAIHYYGYAHCALTAENYLIDKVNHRGQLIDFAFCRKFGSKIGPRIKSAVYPPEIDLDNAVIGPYTDVYMAGKILWDLAGGHFASQTFRTDTPSLIKNFLRGITLHNYKSRIDDVDELHSIVTDIGKTLYGKPKYVQLEGV